MAMDFHGHPLGVAAAALLWLSGCAASRDEAAEAGPQRPGFAAAVSAPTTAHPAPAYSPQPRHRASTLMGAQATMDVPVPSQPSQAARQDLLVNPPVAVPPPGMPPEVAVALREIGPRIDGAGTTSLYAPLHAGRAHPQVQVRRELAYGPDARHRADVFTPRAPDGAPRPMLVFAYGGGFRGAYRSAPDSPFYDNIGYWAAENGLIGVTIQYRLAPQVTWPAGAEDIARVVEWVRQHAAEWGGDASKVFLWGHSSGAAHVADYLARTPRTPVTAAILMSGIFDLTNPEASMWSHYYGEDASQYAARSSLPRLIEVPLPVMAVWAELDPSTFVPDTERLIKGRRDAGTPVVELRLPNHSHLSEAYAVGTADQSLTAPLLQFIRQHSAPRR